MKQKEGRLKVGLWWTGDVQPRSVSKKDVLAQMLAVWSVESLQLSAPSGFASAIELSHPRTHPSLGSPLSVTGHCGSKDQTTSVHAGQFQWAVYAAELSVGSAKAFLDLRCSSISPSTRPCFLPSFL